MSVDLGTMLKKEEFFSNLPQEDLNAFVDSLHLEKRPKNSVLISQGENQQNLFIIQSGTVQKSSKEGFQSLLKKGQLSGFFHFYQQDPSPATLTCVEDCEIWVMTSDEFKKVLEKSNSFHDLFISFLTRQVRRQLKTLNTFQSKKPLVAFYDTKGYQRAAFEKLLQEKYTNMEFLWLSEKLSKDTASFAQNCDAVCCFVNDDVGTVVLDKLNEYGIQMVAMRCAGFDNVDLETIKKYQMSVTRVPEYSPYAVAEFATGVLLSLNRKIHKAYQRTKEHNFSLDNFVGFDLHGKTVGVLGTGKIGKCFINIMSGFGCNVLCYDVRQDPEIVAKKDVRYTTKEEVFEKSDVISLHLPLLKSTKHFLNKEAFDQMKKGVILVNTSRGGLIDSESLLDAIVSGKVAGAGLDVYEGEKEFFFENKSEQDIQDTVLSRLLSSPRVLITSHQAFLTNEALHNIADTTLTSLNEYLNGKRREELTYQIK